MDMASFGIVSIGAAGGMLFLVATLEKAGISINGAAITFLLELTKYGGILYILKEMARIFT
ncbi:MAG TPA: hypothetical protein VIG80_14355 [Bacillaceae bacterium]